MLHFNSFGGRAILFALVTVVLSVVFGLCCTGTIITSGQFVLYPTLISLVGAILTEPISAVIQKRRMNFSELGGGGIFGAISAGMAIALACYAWGIIV